MGFPSFGPVELGIIAFIIMLIFGVGKLPEVAGGLGKAIRGFRHEIAGEDEELAKDGAELARPAGRPRRDK